MGDKAESGIYRLSAACVVMVVMALVVPRFLPAADEGLAGGASAVMTFLFMLALALLFSLYLLMVTVRRFRDLSVLARVAGIGPSIVLALGLSGIISLLRF